jgi:hypothetical protein
MSAGNYFETQRAAHSLRTVDITTSATVGAYTVRTGGATYNFIQDRVINVTTTGTYDLAVTIPDGTYSGQRLNINYVAEGDNASVTFTVTSGSATDLTAASGYTILEWTHDSCDGWVEISASAT